MTVENFCSYVKLGPLMRTHEICALPFYVEETKNICNHTAKPLLTTNSDDFEYRLPLVREQVLLIFSNYGVKLFSCFYTHITLIALEMDILYGIIKLPNFVLKI